MLAFLYWNGWEAILENAEIADWILDFSAGLTPQDFVTRLRAHTHQIRSR